MRIYLAHAAKFTLLLFHVRGEKKQIPHAANRNGKNTPSHGWSDTHIWRSNRSGWNIFFRFKWNFRIRRNTDGNENKIESKEARWGSEYIINELFRAMVRSFFNSTFFKLAGLVWWHDSRLFFHISLSTSGPETTTCGGFKFKKKKNPGKNRKWHRVSKFAHYFLFAKKDKKKQLWI